MNDVPMANMVTSDLEDLTEFILDAAHIADHTVTVDTELPDAPTLHEALAGPKQERWHQAILEELAAIKDAGTWELVDPSPHICNIIGCRFALQKK